MAQTPNRREPLLVIVDYDETFSLSRLPSLASPPRITEALDLGAMCPPDRVDRSYAVPTVLVVFVPRIPSGFGWPVVLSRAI